MNWPIVLADYFTQSAPANLENLTMTENATSQTAAPEEKFNSTCTVEDLGATRKKLSIAIPEEQIAKTIGTAYKTLQREAAIPGFRRGRTPRRLLEKRFGSAISDQVKQELVKESIESAVAGNELKLVGEPELDVAKLEVPETGPFTFSVTVEVEPEFPLPDLANIEIKKPIFQPTDERLDLAMQHLRRGMGQWAKTSNPAGPEDMIQANVKVLAEDGSVIHNYDEVPLAVKSSAVGGLRFENLQQSLTGAQPGKLIELKTTGPADHADETLRGKNVTVQVTPLAVSHFEAPELTDKLATDSGFDSLEEMRQSMREALTKRLTGETQGAMRVQVLRYLLERCELSVPENLSARQQNLVLRRRVSQLFSQGISPDDVSKHVEELRASSLKEATNELKTFFILKKIGEQFNVKITADDIFEAASDIAFQEGQRPEKFLQQLKKSGGFEQFVTRVFDDKVLDTLIGNAKVTEVDEAAWRAELSAAAASAAPAKDAPAASPDAT